MIVLGICGASGSGKTYLLNQLCSRLGRENISLIKQDNYYKPRKEQPIEDSGYINFDLPTALDKQQFIRDFQRLYHGFSIHNLQYEYNRINASPIYIKQDSCPILIVEGILIFHFEAISKYIDCKIFVEANPAVCLTRRLERDQKERGYQKVEIIYRFKHHALPAYQKYVLPYKKQADFIIPNDFTISQACLAKILKYILNSKKV